MNMDRAIFDLKISVEAASLYIVLCALMDAGQPPTLENARLKWTGTDESLLTAAQELV
jgi:multisubunit Na+/H+ antiporter MnhC subunit